MNSQLKKFDGWRALAPNERIQVGDKFVLIYQRTYPGRAATPASGESVDRYIGHPASEWDCATVYWYPYRKTTHLTIPRRIIMNRFYSDPLPIP